MASTQHLAADSDALADVSIKIRNYKCFAGTHQGFDVIKPINVLIGRNNSGKSSLLDLIEYAVSPKKGYLELSGYKGNQPEVILSKPLIESEIKKVFREDTSDNAIGNYWIYGERFVGKKITIGINYNRKNELSNRYSALSVHPVIIFAFSTQQL